MALKFRQLDRVALEKVRISRRIIVQIVLVSILFVRNCFVSWKDVVVSWWRKSRLLSS